VSDSNYHVPVLAEQVCRYLITDEKGVYLDGTLGGGGHAEHILKKLDAEALYIGLDRDPEALTFSKKRLARFKNVVFYHGVFTEMEAAMQLANVETLTGVLLDLGISSYQVDQEARGFTFRSDVPLDMRMDPSRQQLTAADVLNHYDYRELIRIFRQYGEEARAACIARQIVKQRKTTPIVSSGQLLKLIDRCVGGKHLKKSYARIFQALRIEVNQELELLSSALNLAVSKLKKGGRLVVISYHSLEDRIVKNFLREQENPCICPPELPECICGRQPTMKALKPKLIRPDEQEVKKNPRARSAKMRVGEKL